MSKNFFSGFHYCQILKVKHREKNVFQIFSVCILLVRFFSHKSNILSNLCKTITRQITPKNDHFGQVVLCKTPVGDYFPEVFYYKAFLQMFSKLTREHPRGNITSEKHLNGRVMLLKGAILFHPYITSSTKTFLWLQENAAVWCKYC